jgi:hypothetical protein
MLLFHNTWFPAWNGFLCFGYPSWIWISESLSRVHTCPNCESWIFSSCLGWYDLPAALPQAQNQWQQWRKRHLMPNLFHNQA